MLTRRKHLNVEVDEFGWQVTIFFYFFFFVGAATAAAPSVNLEPLTSDTEILTLPTISCSVVVVFFL